MGGCPDAMEEGCLDETIPTGCEDYLVDLGAHWELATTEMGLEYSINSTNGSGNNDDEFSVSPNCRFDDNDSAADNEWSGSWSHSNPVEGGEGVYRFEIARTLATASSVSDAQMAVGGTYEFGIAFWDPFETDEGWTAAGHFLTGCSTEWIELVIEGGSSSNGTAGGQGNSTGDDVTEGSQGNSTVDTEEEADDSSTGDETEGQGDSSSGGGTETGAENSNSSGLARSFAGAFGLAVISVVSFLL
jgi:hypothetical protein